MCFPNGMAVLWVFYELFSVDRKLLSGHFGKAIMPTGGARWPGFGGDLLIVMLCA